LSGGNKKKRERVVRMRRYMEEVRSVRVEGSRANIGVNGVYLQIEIPEKVSSASQHLACFAAPPACLLKAPVAAATRWREFGAIAPKIDNDL
jgi:hypothetical protein